MAVKQPILSQCGKASGMTSTWRGTASLDYRSPHSKFYGRPFWLVPCIEFLFCRQKWNTCMFQIRLSRNSQFHYHAHKIPQLRFILRQTALSPTHLVFLRSIWRIERTDFRFEESHPAVFIKSQISNMNRYRYTVRTHHHHHHKHQGLDPLIRSVSRVTTVFDNGFSVFQLFFFLVVCSDMISKGFGLVAFFANVKTSSVCIHLSCPVCIQSLVHGVRSRLFCDHKACSLLGVSTVRTQMCYIIRYYTTYQLHVSAIT